MTDPTPPKHLTITEPSAWVTRWAGLIKPAGRVLDVAAGGGRHGRLFLERGHPVTFVDRTIAPLADLEGHPDATIVQADLEDGSPPEGVTPWPFAGQAFDAVVVVNYLHRALFPDLLACLAPGGVLIYETFARGNEDYARPRNPDHLLTSGELLELAHGRLQVVGYEHGVLINGDIPGVKQRLVAVNDLHASTRDDGEPRARPIQHS